MNKFLKKHFRVSAFVAALMALLMAVAMLGACTDPAADDHTEHVDENGDNICDVCGESMGEEPVPVPDETEVAEYYFTDELGSGLPCFIHFKDDGTYYIAFYGGAFKDAGTYELVEEELDYMDATVDDPNGAYLDPASKKTAPAYIQLNSYTDVVTMNWVASGEMEPTDKLPLVDGTIPIGSSMTALVTFKADEDYGDPNGIESNFRVEIVKLYAENNETKTFVLYHDGTYEDLTGTGFAGGTYEFGDTDGTYLLTDDLSGETVTLTINGDGTATFGDRTFTESVKSDRTFEGTLAISTITGEHKDYLSAVLDGQSMDLELRCNAADGTFQLIGSGSYMGGAVALENIVLGSGTYTEEPDPTYLNAIPKFTFAAEGTGIAIESSVAVGTEATYTLSVTFAEAPTVINAMGGSFNVNFNGTATLTLVVPIAL